MTSERVKLTKLWEYALFADGLGTMVILADLTLEQWNMVRRAAFFLQRQLQDAEDLHRSNQEARDGTP